MHAVFFLHSLTLLYTFLGLGASPDNDGGIYYK